MLSIAVHENQNVTGRSANSALHGRTVADIVWMIVYLCTGFQGCGSGVVR